MRITSPRTIMAALIVAAVAITTVLYGDSVVARVQDLAYVPKLTVDADPADGPALVHEAIDNVRKMKKFRFDQTVGSGADAKGASGEVDLSSGASNPPKLKTKTTLHDLNGIETPLEVVTIGDEVHAKLPKQTSYKKTDQKPVKSKGKSAGAGGGHSEVDVLDPVMQMLEPVDKLPDSAFGTPSAPDADGFRSVTVTSGGVTLTLKITDSTHLIKEIGYSATGKSAAFMLKDFGDAGIDIKPE
jgi:hypothetical protein